MALVLTENIQTPEISITQSISENIAQLKTEGVLVWAYMPSGKLVTIESVQDNSVCVNQLVSSIATSRKRLTESVTQPSRNSFLKQKLEEAQRIYSKLEFNNPGILEVVADLIKDCINQDKFDIVVSLTGENELLIYREQQGVFNNVIIDSDGDIEFLHIPVDRSQTYNEHIPFIDNIDTYSLATKL